MIVLVRQWDTPFGVFGRLITDAGNLWSLENPWEDNKPFVSCIPPGKYAIKPDTFRDQYENVAVLDVPGRSAIEFHRGNTALDTSGCILPGMSIGCIGDQWAVTQSGDALELVNSVVPESGSMLYVLAGGTQWQKRNPLS